MATEKVYRNTIKTCGDQGYGCLTGTWGHRGSLITSDFRQERVDLTLNKKSVETHFSEIFFVTRNTILDCNRISTKSPKLES